MAAPPPPCTRQAAGRNKAAPPPPLPPSPPPTHVVFVLPGLWGRPVDLQVVASTVQERLGDSLVVISAVNALFRSYHGVDVCGTRLAEEIKALLLVHPQLTHLSFVCYSAGGLFARYAVGILKKEGILGKKEKQLQPLAFITLATPHLGCRDLANTAQGRRRNSIQESLSDFYAHRSGIQMMLLDQDTGSHLPLLLQMALPSSSFYQALALFKHVAFYANANNDHIVHYSTAAIAPSNPYLQDSVSLPPPGLEGYNYVVKETRVDLEGEKTEGNDDEEVEVVGQPPASHYGRLHPLALPVLMPFIVVHALLLMTPLRLLAGVTAASANAAGSCHDDDATRHHDHPQVHVDEVPELIRKHLINLPIHRVDIFLPGMHTHGTIIVRRPMIDKDGREVVEHAAARLAKVLRDQ